MDQRDDIPSTEALYRQFWRYVYGLLPAYGVFGDWQDDVAQDVWETVHKRLLTYKPEDGTARAWLTGIVRRCADHHRRRRRREQVGLLEDLRDAAAASTGSDAELDDGRLRGRGPLDPEQHAVIYWIIRRALEDDEQFEAFVLHHFLGNTIAEIAVIQGATESAVEWRIHMAKKRLQRDDDARSTAFAGFGTLEALVEAMRPPPQPSERGEELWRRISARIGPLPGPAPVAPIGLFLSKPLLAGLLGGAFLIGGGVGAGAVLLWQHLSASRTVTAHMALEPEPVIPVAPPEGTAPAGPAVLAVVRVTAPTADATVRSSTRAAPRPAPRSSKGPPAEERSDDAARESSLRLIRQMRAAGRHRNCTLVRALVDEHARTFPNLDVAAREAERARCW